jgi:hypothetical protein
VAELSWSSYSSTPGDHARFFEGDPVREGEDNGDGSLTGTCVILLPRRVCVVVTSNVSGFGLESLILGIEGLTDAGIVVVRGAERWKRVLMFL